MSAAVTDAARRAVEAAARSSYGRLVAFLAARWHDVAAAEDALSDAFASALATWPRDGVPDCPEAWLLTAARRELLHRARHLRVASDPALRVLFEDATIEEPTETRFPDERLKLMFVCAHPAIDPAARTPLMLQTVLGLDAARIASAFLVAPASMSQRLVRAKTRIRDAGLRFDVPDPAELPARLDSVLEAIYAAYGRATDSATGADPHARGLAEEALWLARILASLMPTEPEALGLLALLLFCEARRGSARSADGRFVPLPAQDPQQWSSAQIREAEQLLNMAAALGRLGHFQLEAAIQSAHSARIHGSPVPWPVIVQLYDGLLAMAPTLGAGIARAAALAEAGMADAALAALDAIDATNVRAVAAYQPWWAVRAHVLALLHRHSEASLAYERALGLSEDPALRDFLREKANASRQQMLPGQHA